MSKIDYGVGDVVVACNKDPIPCKSGHYRNHLGGNCPKVGAVVRVDSITNGICGCLEINFDGIRVLADRFRLLPKADEQFTEYMRRMKPVKRSVEA